MQPEQNNITRGALAVKRAYSSSDIIVLTATFVTFFIATSLYFLLSFLASYNYTKFDGLEFTLSLFGALVGGGFVFLLILGFGMFYVRMMRQMMLGNSLQVEYSDYAWLRDWANIVAKDLELPHVEIFITQDPYINAYAFGFMNPYCIVLHSGSIRWLTHEELKVVVVHEMGHIKYGHTIASVYLQPFLAMPVIGPLATWIAGFWQRRAELTCDRLALMYSHDPELVKKSLITVHVGPDVSKSMNEVARQWLQYNAERPMNRFAQTFSTHPFLVRRLSQIDAWKHVVENPTAGGQAEQYAAQSPR